jgi:putative ABC transport system substrate-binding protein
MDRVGRRKLLIAGGVIGAAPIVARALPPGKIPRVGVLFGGASGPSPDLDAFRRGLRERGYIEGQNIAIEYRFASGQVGKLPELAAELVRLNVDVIVAPSTPTALAAKGATSTIPIVFAVVADPRGAGLIDKLARPGGNITGVTSSSAELGGKRLGLLKEVAPKASRVAVLYNPADPSNLLVVNQLRNSAPILGLVLQMLEVHEPRDFEGAFFAMTREGTHAMFGAAGVLTNEHKQVLVDLASNWRMTAMWGHRQFVDAGGLMSYAVNRYQQFEQAGLYVDKILKGAKPADLPVEQPTRFELVINMKNAKALGLNIPQSVLLRAEEVIQ